MQNKNSLLNNLANIQLRIIAAEKKFKRKPNSVTLLPVSKYHPVSSIKTINQAGILSFAENHLTEALEKIKETASLNLQLQWHFIGHIQSNKTKNIANNFSWVHSIERFKIAQLLSNQRSSSLPLLNICIQVNISQESQKSGVLSANLLHLALQISELPRIKLRGLMCIPAKSDNFAEQCIPFAKLKQCSQLLVDNGIKIDTLSMGMSQDLEAAIASGSTCVRIGTALFGVRSR